MKLNITVEPHLRNITCPTLILYGEHDFIVEAAPRRIHGLINGSQLVVIPDSGHYPFIERPEQFTSAVRRFVTDRSPRSPDADSQRTPASWPQV
jgi:proline iminopeptidase